MVSYYDDLIKRNKEIKKAIKVSEGRLKEIAEAKEKRNQLVDDIKTFTPQYNNTVSVDNYNNIIDSANFPITITGIDEEDITITMDDIKKLKKLLVDSP